MGFLDPTFNEFQAHEANTDYTSYADAIRRAQEQQALAQQQQNAQIAQLQGTANGQGPSVAQGMLQQATDQNIRAGAAQLGGARGVNPALAARLVSQNQLAAGQQMAGQGAVLRSQEQMGAQSALAQALAQKRAQDMGMFGQAGGLQNQQNTGIMQNSFGAQGLNAGVEAQNAKASNDMNAAVMGGITGAVTGAAGAAAGMAEGGQVPGPARNITHVTGKPKFAFADSGYSPYVHAILMRKGGRVPGRASVPGNSPRNDTVPAMVSPGEVVLPRTVAMAGDAPKRAAAFVAALKKRKAA